jgi:hypothetical protein
MFHSAKANLPSHEVDNDLLNDLGTTYDPGRRAAASKPSVERTKINNKNVVASSATFKNLKLKAQHAF